MDKITNAIRNFNPRDMLQDKKKLLILILIIGIIVVLIFNGKGRNTAASGFGDQLNNVLSKEYYSATGTTTICNTVFDVSLTKSLKNYQFGFSENNLDYSSLITKYNDTLYFNTAPFVSKGGLASVKCESHDDEKDPPVTLKKVLLKSLNSEYFSYKANDDDQYYEAKIDTPENWAAFFTELAASLKENKEEILRNYKDVSVAEKEYDIILEDVERLAAAKGTGNSLTFTLSYDSENKKYSFGIDFGADFADLPAFISQDSFDTNKFTFLASFNFSFADNTVNVPSGYVYAMGTNTINGFISDCWNSLFARKAYHATNEVTQKADSVTNKIDLGSTIETYQYLFDKDGVSEGVLIVTSYDKNIVKQYADKFNIVKSFDEAVIFDKNTNKYSLSISLSENAIDSVNKIATTPSGLAAFFKTAEGVVPIV